MSVKSLLVSRLSNKFIWNEDFFLSSTNSEASFIIPWWIVSRESQRAAFAISCDCLEYKRTGNIANKGITLYYNEIFCCFKWSCIFKCVQYAVLIYTLRGKIME